MMNVKEYKKKQWKMKYDDWMKIMLNQRCYSNYRFSWNCWELVHLTKKNLIYTFIRKSVNYYVNLIGFVSQKGILFRSMNHCAMAQIEHFPWHIITGKRMLSSNKHTTDIQHYFLCHRIKVGIVSWHKFNLASTFTKLKRGSKTTECTAQQPSNSIGV